MLNFEAFLGLFNGREQEEGDGRKDAPTSHSIISLTFFSSFYSMADPGARHTEAIMELIEQKAFVKQLYPDKDVLKKKKKKTSKNPANNDMN